MADWFIVARIGIEPLPVTVWAAVAQGIADALDDLGYDARYRTDGAIIAQSRAAASRDVAPADE